VALVRQNDTGTWAVYRTCFKEMKVNIVLSASTFNST